MGTALKELIGFLEEVAPLHLQESYDNAGLIIGDDGMIVSGVIVALDSIEAVVDEAIEMNCNVIIAHHPIVFSGLKKITGANYIQRTILKAIKNDIAIYAIHTNLDNVLRNGVNEKIAQKIGLENLKLLSPKEDFSSEKYTVGSGIVGTLPNSTDVMSFLSDLKVKMELNTIKHTGIVKNKVQKIAVCGGSGGFLLNKAIKEEADVFITADYKYHEYFDANNKIMVADIGHYESERFTIDLLHGLITNKFRKFAAHYTKINTNPINYF